MTKLVNEMITGTVIVLALISLAGCSKSSMQKLASDQVYPDMNNAYWSNQQEQNTELWKQALAYCQQHTGKPNCAPVNLNFMLSNGNTKLVPLNSNPLGTKN